MQLNPARGRKLVKHITRLSDEHDTGFMQLNPARGRKLTHGKVRHIADGIRVYAAQPREGTETHRAQT